MSPFGPHNETGPSLSMVVFELSIHGIKRNLHTGFAPTQCGYMNGVVLLSQLLHIKTIIVLLQPTWLIATVLNIHKGQLPLHI